MHADWYFDVISPFAYLQFMQLDKVTDRAELTPVSYTHLTLPTKRIV